MPMYEFMCPKCDHKDEFIKKFSQFEEVEICPKCGEVMFKTISTVKFILADGFWYRNGYQNQGKKDMEEALKENQDIYKKYNDNLE